MIRAVLIINLFFISLTACRQKTKDFFTGTIRYQYTYSSNTLNADSLAESRPAAAVFRYDLADYQSMFTGKDTIIYYYAGKKIRRSVPPEIRSAFPVKTMDKSPIPFYL
ncbi:MAG: hypothetical protein IPG86_09230 [Chitinophagaceae bacterium]|nr:hypothetical protein [Chitinophagaceae bacterium]